MHYRIGVDAPERLDPAMCRGSVLTQLRPQLELAQKVFPPFRDAASAGEGLDLLLTPDQVVALVAEGVDKLREAGIAVMLPRAWMTAQPALRLEVSPRDDQPTGSVRGATEARVGFDQLVDYKWKLRSFPTTRSGACPNPGPAWCACATVGSRRIRRRRAKR